VQLDAGCSSTYSVQLEGDKIWLFWPPEELKDTDFAFSPMGTVMKPGDILFFSPGWKHETHVVSAPSLSMSVNWDHPDPEFSPTEYYKVAGRNLIDNHTEYCFCGYAWGLGIGATLAAFSCGPLGDAVSSRAMALLKMVAILLPVLFLAYVSRRRLEYHPRKE
jgi:hypothetical protein